MMRRFTPSLPYLAAVVVGYLVPAALAPFLGDMGGKGLTFTSLLLINPLVTATAATLFTHRHGVTWWFPLVAAALFVPIMFIPPLNDSALIYAALYAITGGLGVGIGWLLRRGQPGPVAESAGA